MFDALLYCQVMADIRHGYFLIVADFVRTITAQFRALMGRVSIGDGAREGRGTRRSLAGNKKSGCRAWRASKPMSTQWHSRIARGPRKIFKSACRDEA